MGGTTVSDQKRLKTLYLVYVLYFLLVDVKVVFFFIISLAMFWLVRGSGGEFAIIVPFVLLILMSVSIKSRLEDLPKDFRDEVLFFYLKYKLNIKNDPSIKSTLIRAYKAKEKILWMKNRVGFPEGVRHIADNLVVIVDECLELIKTNPVNASNKDNFQIVVERLELGIEKLEQYVMSRYEHKARGHERLVHELAEIDLKIDDYRNALSDLQGVNVWEVNVSSDE